MESVEQLQNQMNESKVNQSNPAVHSREATRVLRLEMVSELELMMERWRELGTALALEMEMALAQTSAKESSLVLAKELSAKMSGLLSLS